jgi:hypothetical protein
MKNVALRQPSSAQSAVFNDFLILFFFLSLKNLS